MDGENLTTSLLHWGAYSFIRRPWSSNLETFLHLLCISDKRNHRWLFLLLVLYCLLSVQFSSGTQSCLTLCKTHGLQGTECQASMFITNSQSLLKLMSIKSVMPSNHLTLCHLLLLLPSIIPSIRGFLNESVLCIRWSKYWGFSFSISPCNEYSGLISFRVDWLDLLAVQGTLKSLLQHHSSKASVLRCSAFFMVQL